MNTRRTVYGLMALALVTGILLGVGLFRPDAGMAQPPNPAPAKFTVVHTEGTNLIVTDNHSNTVYFYTVDQGAEPGSDLKLRATVDLSQVGKQVLTPKLLKKSN